MPKFKKVALGGTFDRLHRGHHQFLTTALKSGDQLTIGLTTDHFPHQKTLCSLIEPYSLRRRQLLNFLTAVKNRVSIIPLEDVYGTTLSDSKIEALVVTDHTIEGAKQINAKRHRHHLKPLPIINAPLVKDDSGYYLSSTRIRCGLVSRQGISYPSLFASTLTLSPSQKNRLKTPQGKLITQKNQLSKINQIIKTTHPTTIAIVGDECSTFFLSKNLPFNLLVYDNLINRRPVNQVKPLLPKNAPVISLTNPPGHLHSSIASQLTAINLSAASPSFIRISGEEDLLVLPLIMLLPLNSLIFYGQPGQGIVAITITATIKDQYYQFLSKG